MKTSTPYQPLWERWVPLGLLLLAYVAGMFTDIMEIDAAQYASMSRGILTQKNPLFLFDRGVAYLDKPPLIFWLTALSYKVLGVSNFSYRLPSILFSVLGIFSVRGLAKAYYGERAGWMAALLTGACQAFFVMNQDVKTDMYLTGSVALAVWQLALFVKEGKWKHLILGFVGVGLGLLAKGPLGIVLPGFAIGGHLLLSRNWKGIFNWKWLLGIPIVALMLLPMCIGLYQQHGKEGLEFFFWTQSFGRVTGDSSWKNDTTPFFLLHSFLWSFLPWTFLLAVALFARIKRWVQQGFRLGKEFEAFGISLFVLGGLSLSFSNFILPHYAYVLTPFAAVLLAGEWANWSDKAWGVKVNQIFSWVHFGLVTVGLIALGLLCFGAFEISFWAISGTAMSIIGFLYYHFWNSKGKLRVWVPAVVGMCLLNFTVNAALYPQLLTWQSGSTAAHYINQEGIPKDKVYGYGDVGRGMDVYLEKDMVDLADNVHVAVTAREQDLFLFVTPDAKAQLEKGAFDFEELMSFEHIRVQRLSLPFINPKTRHKMVGKRELLYLPQQTLPHFQYPN